jgi:hypothetical protein
MLPAAKLVHKSGLDPKIALVRGATRVWPMPTDSAKYSIELFKPGGEGAGIEEILDRHTDLKVARSIYRAGVEKFPGRLIMLCDGAQVLARSDRPETMPR